MYLVETPPADYTTCDVRHDWETVNPQLRDGSVVGGWADARMKCQSYPERRHRYHCFRYLKADATREGDTRVLGLSLRTLPGSAARSGHCYLRTERMFLLMTAWCIRFAECSLRQRGGQQTESEVDGRTHARSVSVCRCESHRGWSGGKLRASRLSLGDM